MVQFCSFNKRRQRTTAKVTVDGIPVVSKALRNFQEFVSVGEPLSIQYYVPTAKSLFCQLMDPFEAKYFDGVPFVDPFLQFAG